MEVIFLNVADENNLPRDNSMDLLSLNKETGKIDTIQCIVRNGYKKLKSHGSQY